MNSQPKIDVGILAGDEINFSLSGEFYFEDKMIEGLFTAQVSDEKISISQREEVIFTGNQIHFTPAKETSFFEIRNVIIGVDFHWEQKENQQFRGALKLIPEGEKVRAINIIDLEEYLKSVISSEMSATSSPDLLKAHAVISRSWLLAQIEKSKSLDKTENNYVTSFETENEIIRWYDREDHETFDVCADDHCQRYQGITKIHSEKALEAVKKTYGEVLFSGKKICDARFSKCCGGITESFENVWEPVDHSYLTNLVDNDKPPVDFSTELEIEANADDWIRNSPEAFCNTSDQQVLSQVLPDFDQATTDFYRWEIIYNQNEISELIKKRSGIDFGKIVKLDPIKRGPSGRLIQLKITGTKKSLTVGKELEIRKWLSESHLYSSAFVVDHLEIEQGIPNKFVLTGAGWGHGVGLCQIGAAVMGEKGYNYKEILNHYFKGAQLEKWY